MTESNLASALARAQAKADRVHADRRNEHMRYDYASANAIMSAAKQALAGEDLCLVPVSHSRISSENGKCDVLLRCWSLEHVSGEARQITGEHPIKTPGRGADESICYDIALTNSLKRTMLDLLQIPRLPAEEDVNHAERYTSGHTHLKKQAPRAEPKAVAAKKPRKAKEMPYAEWTDAQKAKYADPDEKISSSTPAGFTKFVGQTLRECSNWQRVIVEMVTHGKLAKNSPYAETAKLLRSRRRAKKAKIQDAEQQECLEFLSSELSEVDPRNRFSMMLTLYELAGAEPPRDSEDVSELLMPANNNFVLLRRLQELWVESAMLKQET